MPRSPALILCVWSDYVCPFCYLEVPELAAVQAHFGERIRIEWRAFELRPEPAPTLDPDGDYLHDTWDRAVYPMARERGMTLRLPTIQPRSRLAHEAAEWARRHDAFEAMHDALFRGFFEESLDLADATALVDLAHRLGLDGGALAQALGDGSCRDAVLADQREAHDLGITGVPAILFSHDGQRLGSVQGAQPRERIIEAIEQARQFAV